MSVEDPSERVRVPVALSWILERDEALSALASRSIGRLAIIEPDGRPDIVPLNYVLDRGAVLFRTGPGRVLDRADGAWVAFEVDATDSEARRGWSVVVHGRAAEVTDPSDLARVRGLPLEPWAAGERVRYVRITPEEITGRRVR